MADTINRRYLDESTKPKEKRPYLTPDVVEGAPDRVRLTVKNAETMRRGAAVLVSFREYPDYVLWLQRRDLLTAADNLGDDVEAWAGRMLPLERVKRTDPHRGTVIDKYAPEPPPDGPSAPEVDARPRRAIRRRLH